MVLTSFTAELLGGLGPAEGAGSASGGPGFPPLLLQVEREANVCWTPSPALTPRCAHLEGAPASLAESDVTPSYRGETEAKAPCGALGTGAGLWLSC